MRRPHPHGQRQKGPGDGRAQGAQRTCTVSAPLDLSTGTEPMYLQAKLARGADSSPSSSVSADERRFADLKMRRPPLGVLCSLRPLREPFDGGVTAASDEDAGAAAAVAAARDDGAGAVGAVAGASSAGQPSASCAQRPSGRLPMRFDSDLRD